LLTSNYTFSSANAFVTAFKCYKIGTIIGQETGGVTIAFGEVVDFKLPNTQLEAFSACKRMYHPCGVTKLQGVLPDITLHQQLADTKAGRDTVLEYTREMIKTRATAEKKGVLRR
jgi:C-terminal processing protease CtpA/Prc